MEEETPIQETDLENTFKSLDREKTKDIKPLEWRFLNEYIQNGGNAIRAAAKVRGYDLNDKKEYYKAACWAGRTMKKLKPTVAEVMEAHGLTIANLIKIGKEGLRAQHTHYSKEGDPHVENDYRTRYLYWDSFVKLKGMYPNQKIDVDLKAKSGVLVVPGIMTNNEEWQKRMEDFRKIFDEFASID